ncbi:MAG: hypothetical protein KAR81_01965, partial [Sulfurimonas sp.]|nr:hypothetical protein [Sulfurimonas sp.]
MTPSLTLVRIIIFVAFLLLFSFVYMSTTKDVEKRVENVLTQQIDHLDNTYKVVKNRFKIISGSTVSSVINQPELLQLLYRAKYAKDEARLAVEREILYKKMKPHFERLKKLGVIIMLFSFEDNKTFLRVHKPSKFNDDVSKVRYSFAYVNANKKPIQGFEQGKISHAFRNIYPLYYNDEYLGSVDIAFSSEVLQETMINLHETETHFILNKSVFESNIWKVQKQVKYIQSREHEDFLFAVNHTHADTDSYIIEESIYSELKEKVYENIKNNASFALHVKNHVVAYLPIKNIKDKKTVAYLVSYKDSFYMKEILKEYFLVNIIFFTVLMILSLIIYINIKQRLFLQIEVDEKTKDLK